MALLCTDFRWQPHGDRREDRSSCAAGIPVSYTHLDVYKRQGPWWPQGLGGSWRGGLPQAAAWLQAGDLPIPCLLWFERLSAAICIKPASIDRKACILLNRWRRRKGGLSAKPGRTSSHGMVSQPNAKPRTLRVLVADPDIWRGFEGSAPRRRLPGGSRYRSRVQACSSGRLTVPSLRCTILPRRSNRTVKGRLPWVLPNSRLKDAPSKPAKPMV